MKHLLTILVAAALAAANPTVKIDAASEAAYTASYAEMAQQLDEDQQALLDRSILDLILIKSGSYRPLSEARSIAKGNAASFAITQPMIDAMIKTAWQTPETKAKGVMKNIAAMVDGKTAPEILALADEMRRTAYEDAISTLQGRLSAVAIEIEAAERELKGAEFEARAKRMVLDQVSLSNPNFRFETPDVISVTKPIIAFGITNGTSIAIKTISVRARVQTPGRAIPWNEGGFLYEFKGGLEPGEHQDLRLALNMFSDWGKIPKEAVTSAETTLTLVGIEDANGTKINEAVDASASKKRDQLLEAEASIREKVEELRQQAAALKP